MTKKKDLENMLNEWDDWVGYREDFHSQKKGPYDSDLRLEVGTKYNKWDPQKFRHAGFLIGQPADRLERAIKVGLSKAEDTVLGYSDTHFAKMLKELGNENVNALYSLVFSMKPYTNGNGMHKQIKDLHLELLKMQSLMGDPKNPDIENMQQYVLSQTSDRYLQDYLSYHMANSPENTKGTFMNLMKSKESELQSYFMTGKDLNRSKLVKYIVHNIKTLKNKETKETDADKKDDLKDEKEAIYLNIAKTLRDVYDAKK